ncbi:hypothetical protein TKK_0013097 [Trichogramma kaykai]|uniref:Ionotropic glutamate receptor C-terminal domain-containing protein n=1 Tax=Trichogramma kaykai TaxID=54128 RepID=A0ABD2WJW1_9HYME
MFALIDTDRVCRRENSYYFADLLEDLKPNVGALLEPFDASIWLSFLSVAGLCACFLLMTSYLRARRLLRESGRVFDICAVLFEQGARLPGHGGIRAVFAMWIVFAFLCGLFYNAAFKTSLMNADHGTNYRTLGQLELDGRDALGGPEAVKEYLNDSENEVLLGLYQRYEIIAADKIIERLLDHAVTVALSKMQIDNVARGLMREPDINLYYIEEPIVTFPLLLYLKKGHPFVSHLQRLAINNAATGAMDYANFSEYALDPPYSSSSYIGLNQFVVAVYVLLIGLSAAGLVLLSEIYHSARKKKKIEAEAAKQLSDTKER